MASPVQLNQWQQWYAEGAEVAELEYLGRGQYDAVRTTVVKVTAAQVHTATGRKFWRERGGMSLVGWATRRATVAGLNPVRLVPIDNKHAVRCLAAAPAAPSST